MDNHQKRKGFLRPNPAITIIALLLIAALLVAAFYLVEIEYAYIPSLADVAESPRLVSPAYDHWGESGASGVTGEGGQVQLPDSENGVVVIDQKMLEDGRKAFYAETYGNEVFLTKVLGFQNGPLTLWNITKALLALRGRGTGDLKVQLADSVKIGDRNFSKGEVISTGLDVPKGSLFPLGIKLSFSRGEPVTGITCAFCHASVDPETFEVVEGAPNTDINAGMLMAMGTNSAAFYPNTSVNPLSGFAADTPSQPPFLPHQRGFEDAVDTVLLSWPPGNFDSTIDLVANPSQIPDSFTRGDHPYGWNGFASGGPFNGLSALANNVHGQNSDSTSHAHLSEPLHGIDTDTFYGTILQNAADPEFRYTSERGMMPTEFFASIDPTPEAPGLSHLVVPPDFPRISTVLPDGIMISVPGRTVWELNNGTSAFQNTLLPPEAGAVELSGDDREMGQGIFQELCARCHSGPAFTNNRIIPQTEIGTEPSRARALSGSDVVYEESPRIFAFDTPVPVPETYRIVDVPQNLPPEQVELAFALNGSPGGYKVKGLLGLWFSPPYLHDGGVAAGADLEEQMGLPGTLLAGIPPDPVNSLRVLLDRNLREKAVEANLSSEALRKVHVAGIGHEFWVDEEAGFSRREQDALIRYLLTLEGDGLGELRSLRNE